MSACEKPRVAVVTNVLSHYRRACFFELVELLGERVHFFVLTQTMLHRHYILTSGANDLPVTFLKGLKWRRPPYDDVHLSDIRPFLRTDPDVVILSAWSEPTFVLVWLWAVLQRKPIVFWIESTERERPQTRITKWIKRMLLSRAAACIVPGERARANCLRLGMTHSRIFVAPNSADRVFFRGKADELAPYRQRIREEMGLKGFTVLFVGRLVESLKGVETFIRACAVLEKEGHCLSVLLVGDGPDKCRYERVVIEEGLRRTRFLGTLDQVTLCKTYTVADVLVLPSRSEVWGFVLNEGMEFGLPLIVSDAVGAAPDLVPGEENGTIVPVGDVGALASALRRLMEDEALRRRMSEASRRIIEDFTPRRWASGVVQAVDGVVGEKN
jgi:glycosyltransferase involved in cell wall biosynthesis